MVLEPTVACLGGSSFFMSAIEAGPYRLLLHRFLSKAEVSPLEFLLGLRRSRAACAWSRVTGRCPAAAWAPRSGRAAARVGACAQTLRPGLPPRPGALSMGTALPVSWLPLPSLGLMPSEHHVLLQPLSRCKSFLAWSVVASRAFCIQGRESVVPTPPG